ncbi:MAG TPA: hypothetical protein VEO54_26325 [Thermoanaerobaculia bacterium]|nr:hypothetical protein [Thermoanaerobaculia bacterium]
MSATTSVVAAKAPPSAFSHLILDPWIAFSWLVFVFTGMISVLMLVQQPSYRPTTSTAPTTTERHATRHVPVAPVSPQWRKPTPSQLLSRFLFTGYVFWSWYFGLAASWRWVLGRLRNLTVTWAAVGCLWGISVGWLFFVMCLVVALLGGGLYQFFRRWWLLAHGRRPAFVGVPSQTESVQARLAELDRLLRNGSITQAEYDRHRDETLRHL